MHVTCDLYCTWSRGVVLNIREATVRNSPEKTLMSVHYWGAFQNLTSNLGLQAGVHAPIYQNTKPKQKSEQKNMTTILQQFRQTLKNKQHLIIIRNSVILHYN